MQLERLSKFSFILLVVLFSAAGSNAGSSHATGDQGSAAGKTVNPEANTATVIQNGGGNVTIIRQSGDSNVARQTQFGLRNRAVVEQEGTSNVADQFQSGRDNRAESRQEGDDNTVKQSQEGRNHSHTVVIKGSGVTVSVQQLKEDTQEK